LRCFYKRDLGSKDIENKRYLLAWFFVFDISICYNKFLAIAFS
jgi:hypothetical protein